MGFALRTQMWIGKAVIYRNRIGGMISPPSTPTGIQVVACTLLLPFPAPQVSLAGSSNGVCSHHGTMLERAPAGRTCYTVSGPALQLSSGPR